MVKKKAVKEMKKAVNDGKQQTLVDVARTKIQKHRAIELAGKEITEQLRDFFQSYCETFPRYDFSNLPTEQDMSRIMDGYPLSEVLPRERMEDISESFFKDMEERVPEDISRRELMDIYEQHLRPNELRARYREKSLSDVM